MVQTIDWAPREKMLKSYELIARYVMPEFQGSTLSIKASQKWARERVETLLERRVKAIDQANADYNKSAPKN